MHMKFNWQQEGWPNATVDKAVDDAIEPLNEPLNDKKAGGYFAIECKNQ